VRMALRSILLSGVLAWQTAKIMARGRELCQILATLPEAIDDAAWICELLP
jgi:ABC-type Fe3+ transport system permease subunit